ncbi:MAG TPA: pilus assembly PilX N-terminal domain-containing protein [Gammaproteobacteria bacterium]|jgi:type IV pilus assembly protein PilX
MISQSFNPCMRQRGIALVTALVMLLILTLIGVTAMNTSTLEEKMAYNMQQDLTAFHAAESGFNLTFEDVNTVTFNPNPVTLAPIDVGSAEVEVTAVFREITPKPPLKKNAKPYSAKYQAAHFDIVSVGTTPNKSRSTVRAGMYQILPGGS